MYEITTQISGREVVVYGLYIGLSYRIHEVLNDDKEFNLFNLPYLVLYD